METSSGSSTSSKRQDSQSSPSKSNGSKSGLSPLAISGALHLSLAAAVLLTIALGRGVSEKIEFEVIDNPKLAEQPRLDLSQQPKPEPPKPKEVARKVFGVSRNAVTSDEAGPGVAVKQGNTVAVAPDNEKLKDSDATSLPIPTDEYLVSKMPSISTQFTIPYPPEARAKKIEGKVVMELLIDAEGRVRNAKILSGPGAGLEDAALKAIYQFKFTPAEVDGKSVAVKIPFTYNFVLKAD